MKVNLLQYQLVNNATGHPLERSPYFMLLSDGTRYFGYTDNDGKTIGIVRKDSFDVKVYLGQEALEMAERF